MPALIVGRNGCFWGVAEYCNLCILFCVKKLFISFLAKKSELCGGYVTIDVFACSKIDRGQLSFLTLCYLVVHKTNSYSSFSNSKSIKTFLIIEKIWETSKK